MALEPSFVRAVKAAQQYLKPQPTVAQVHMTFEFPQAEERYGLKVWNVSSDSGIWKVAVGFKGNPDVYYLTLWSYKGRPYIRHWDGDNLVDIFLLPAS